MIIVIIMMKCGSINIIKWGKKEENSSSKSQDPSSILLDAIISIGYMMNYQ
jgi:hypothetical protein